MSKKLHTSIHSHYRLVYMLLNCKLLTDFIFIQKKHYNFYKIVYLIIHKIINVRFEALQFLIILQYIWVGLLKVGWIQTNLIHFSFDSKW